MMFSSACRSLGFGGDKRGLRFFFLLTDLQFNGALDFDFFGACNSCLVAVKGTRKRKKMSWKKVSPMKLPT